MPLALRLSEGLGSSALLAESAELAFWVFCLVAGATVRAVAVLRVCGAGHGPEFEFSPAVRASRRTFWPDSVFVFAAKDFKC
jgi:hypothetical protein